MERAGQAWLEALPHWTRAIVSISDGSGRAESPARATALACGDRRRQRVSRALNQKEHTADRWIAATAIRVGIPLISNDGIFRGAPGPQLETLASG